jgi:hypothetical protein
MKTQTEILKLIPKKLRQFQAKQTENAINLVIQSFYSLAL